MSKLFLIIGATVVVLGGINAKAEERPAFERFGFPITQTQVAVLGSAGVRERSPTPTLMLYGMPASPHQVAVLSPRPRSVKEMAPSSLTTGLAPPSSDAPLNYKFAIGIPLAALVDDRSCGCGLMRTAHDDTFLSEILEASRSGPCAESPAYARQTGRPARQAT